MADHGNVKILKDKGEWDTLHADKTKTIVVDFTATWCGPCRLIAPVFEELSIQYPHLIFLKVDVDEHQDVSQSESISAMPTFKIYKGGKVVEELVGASSDKLKAMVAKHA